MLEFVDHAYRGERAVIGEGTEICGGTRRRKGIREQVLHLSYFRCDRS